MKYVIQNKIELLKSSGVMRRNYLEFKYVPISNGKDALCNICVCVKTLLNVVHLRNKDNN